MAGATGHEAAATLVAAAGELAAAFDDGGRLLVSGAGRALTDARHVAVEFLHPVIVGKRALPAAVGRRRAGSRDVGMAIALRRRARRRRRSTSPSPTTRWPAPAMSIALPPGDGSDDTRPRRRRSSSYHLLWELVHLFLDAGVATGGGSDALDALYPMISAGPAQSADIVAAARRLDRAEARRHGRAPRARRWPTTTPSASSPPPS